MPSSVKFTPTLSPKVGEKGGAPSIFRPTRKEWATRPSGKQPPESGVNAETGIMLKILKVFISLTFALMAAMAGIFAVAIAKAIVPVFRLTSGTKFEVYVQDPILYTLVPLYGGYMAFREVMSKSMNERVLKSTALGVAAGIVTTIVGTFAIPFRSFEGPLRWLLILAQFPIVPFVVAYIVYRITLMIYLAADQGQADAQFNLGGRYINGEGVPQDATHQGVRPMVDEDYSLDRILQRARAASPTGEVSPATRKRLETLSRELEEVNKKLEEHQEKQAWKEAQRAFDLIKEEVAREERKAGRKRTQSELDAEFDGLVKDLDKLLAGRKSPEEEELAQKREELELLQNQLAERELFLANLRAELAAFEGRYLREVGVLYAELDDWNAKIAESVAQQEGTEEARAAATQARSQAEESHAAAHGEAAEPGEFSPSPELKSLYREAAKLVHPDLATDDADRQRRELLMKEANRAYQEGDADALRRIIEEYESSPESVKGAGVGADLVRVIRQIKQVRVRLAQIELEIASLTDSEIAKLKAKAEEASKQGRDLLAEMAENVKRRVEAARGRYESRSMSATP